MSKRDWFARLLLLLSLLFFAALAFVGWRAQAIKTGERFLIYASSVGTRFPMDIWKAADNKPFLLTFEMRRAITLKAGLQSMAVTLVETNADYPRVGNFGMSSGSFFAGDGLLNSKRIVLNIPAAYRLFGSTDVAGIQVTIDDEIYTVIGVLDDREPREIIYSAPGSRDADPSVFMAAAAGGQTLTQPMIERAFIPLGVQPLDYQYVDLGLYSGFVKEQVILCGGLFLWSVLLLAMKTFWQRAALQYGSAKIVWKSGDMPGALFKTPGFLTAALITGVLALLACGFSFWLAKAAVIFLLRFQDAGNPLAFYSGDCFGSTVEQLRRWYLYGNSLAVVSIASTIMSTIYGFMRPRLQG